MSTGVYFDSAALLDRLTDGVSQSDRQVIFLVGSALSAPEAPNKPGVPRAPEMVDLVRQSFQGGSLKALEETLLGAKNPYQAAMAFLLARRGQNAVNGLIKTAVWRARKPSQSDASATYTPDARTPESTLNQFDAEVASWYLPPATNALGALVARQPGHFGQALLTTNFDPLVQASIRLHGGMSYRTVLHRDGDLGQTQADGCHVIHAHGYWYGSETLHTPWQLTQQRPRLRASLARLLQGKILVVLGYGGWDDVFADTLFDIIQDDRQQTEIIWATFSDGPSIPLSVKERLGAGLDRGVVTIYEYIDCHSFLPKLSDSWGASLLDAPSSSVIEEARTQSVDTLLSRNIYGPPPYQITSSRKLADFLPSFRDQDRPPIVEHYVGRSSESNLLDTSKDRLVFITGIGGQGKSALAANYLTRHRGSERYTHIVWRDCKEESERFESQICDIVYELMDRSIDIEELSKVKIDDLFDMFINAARHHRLLLIFDNIDHFIDLENGVPAGTSATFVRKILASDVRCRIIFTCRPPISATEVGGIELRLAGLDVSATVELFSLRGVSTRKEEIVEAHSLTNGHAFWLDLIAAQCARSSSAESLSTILRGIPAGEAELPFGMLKSIWDDLKDRDRLALRGLSEMVRPVTAAKLSEYLRTYTNWNQLSKAIRFLRSCNLIVVKLQDGNVETLELHPLVRSFVRRTTPKAEKATFLDAILSHFTIFFGTHRKELAKRVTPDLVERWLEAAEISVSAGKPNAALGLLSEVKNQIQSSGYLLEFIRIATTIFKSSEWTEDSITPAFDDVFSELLENMSYLGRMGECLDLLEMYKDTVPTKNARYINYCNMMCHFHWTSADYVSAVKWGSDGVRLKEESGVDTQFDCAHNLALAQRDSGSLDEALKFFLGENSLDEVCEPSEGDIDKGGAFYGNIGRCLQLMGQVDNPLRCFRKSAALIEVELASASVANKGYIRQWVSELYYAKGDHMAASAFLAAAIGQWQLVSPPRAATLQSRFDGDGSWERMSLVSIEAGEQAFGTWLHADLD